MKKILLTFLIISSILVVTAAVTKPSENHFKAWLSENLKKEQPKQESFLDKMIKKGVQAQMEYTVSYTDKTLYAYAETTNLNQRIKFIGLFGQWYPIDSRKAW